MTSPDPYLVGADYGGGLFGRSEELIEPSRPGASADDLLEGLTEPQQRAVLHRGGPLLIVAGAGSGKTRVLTRRIAHLLATGDARPFEILAITFTNKAAGEMRERVAELVGPTAKRMWVATTAAPEIVYGYEIGVAGPVGPTIPTTSTHWVPSHT
jgi:hypothetical protein